MVAATCSWNTHNAAKLKNAANRAALFWRQSSSSNDGGNRIRAVVKPVHEIECQPDQYQQRQNPDINGQRLHYEFSIRISWESGFYCG